MPDSIASKLYKSNLEIFKEYDIGLIGIKNNILNYYIESPNINHKFYINPAFISSIAKCLLVSKSQSLI